MPRARSLDEERKRFTAAATVHLQMLRTECPEHFMEATPQGKQREITMASLALVHERRPEVQYFNELLVQYRRKGENKIRQVVPDNMVVVHAEPIEADTSFDLPLQPARPLWTLEYVSKGSLRKDYEDSFRKYERDLRVPYYLTFYPDNDELTLYRLGSRKRYVSVKPNDDGRHPIPELELEVALCGGWVRFWFRGELLPLPGALLRERDELQQRLTTVEQQLADMRAELDKLRAERRSG
jgi:Uma2 family endonuclease